MVFIKVKQEYRAPLQNFLKQEGILIGGRPPTFRLVLHRDIKEEDVTKQLRITVFSRTCIEKLLANISEKE